MGWNASLRTAGKRLRKAGDVFLGISTSGNSENVMYAAGDRKRQRDFKAVRSYGKDRESRKASQMSLLSCRSRRPIDPGTPPADLPCACLMLEVQILTRNSTDMIIHVSRMLKNPMNAWWTISDVRMGRQQESCRRRTATGEKL